MKSSKKTNEMPKRIVRMIHNLRREHKISMDQLCEGICTRSMFEKVEGGVRNINRDSLNRLLARLGIDQKKYEKYLDCASYDRWKVRNAIINAIEDGEYHKAENLLNVYKEQSSKNGNIEKQIYIFLKAQLLQNREESADSQEIYELYKEAALLTIPRIYVKNLNEILLSTDELNLMLECKCRELHGEDVYEVISMYQEFIDYIDNSQLDLGGKAKVYPKVVFYMYKHVAKYMENMDAEEREQLYERVLKLCERAIDTLRDDCKAYYLSEVLTIHIELLEYLTETVRDMDKQTNYEKALCQSKAWLETYKNVCQRYGISCWMKDDCYLYREEYVHCIGDVIKKRRIMKNIGRTELCKGVCSTKTLMRVENHMSRGQEHFIDELLERLGLSIEYIHMGIITDSGEAVELYEKYRKAVNSNELDLAEEFIDTLEKKIPQYTANKQMISQARNIVKWIRGEIKGDRFIENLKKIISSTINLKGMSECGEICYLGSEISNMCILVEALTKEGRLQEAYKYNSILWKYYEGLERNAEGIHIGQYEMVMNSYSSLMGRMGKYEEANDVSDRLNKLLLKRKRTNLLHLNMYNKARNNKDNGNCNVDYYTELGQCINLCEFTKNKHYVERYRQEMDKIM